MSPSALTQSIGEPELSNIVPLNVERKLAEVFAVPDFTGDVRPPRSAKLIAACSWSWSPGNGRSETYLLHGTRDRKKWTLWVHAPGCDIGTCYSIYAWGYSAVRFTPPEAARALLRAAWTAEWDLYQTPGPGLWVDREGILGSEELIRLAGEVFREDDD